MANYLYHRDPYRTLSNSGYLRAFLNLPPGGLAFMDREPRTAFEFWLQQLRPSFAQRRALWANYEDFWNRYLTEIATAPLSHPRSFAEYLGTLNPTRELLRLPAEFRGQAPSLVSRPRWLSF
jgi:hypothetical protein